MGQFGSQLQNTLRHARAVHAPCARCARAMQNSPLSTPSTLCSTLSTLWSIPSSMWSTPSTGTGWWSSEQVGVLRSLHCPLWGDFAQEEEALPLGLL